MNARSTVDEPLGSGPSPRPHSPTARAWKALMWSYVLLLVVAISMPVGILFGLGLWAGRLGAACMLLLTVVLQVSVCWGLVATILAVAYGNMKVRLLAVFPGAVHGAVAFLFVARLLQRIGGGVLQFLS